MSERGLRIPRLPAEDRYHRDPVFRSLVDVMLMHIRNAEFTPTELREAAILAATIHNRTVIRYYTYPWDSLAMALCNHANEQPRGVCDCPPDCGCRERMCRS